MTDFKWLETDHRHLAPDHLKVVGPIPGSSSTNKKGKRQERSAPYVKDPSFNHQGHKQSKDCPHFPYPKQHQIECQVNILHLKETFKDLYVQDLVSMHPSFLLSKAECLLGLGREEVLERSLQND